MYGKKHTIVVCYKRKHIAAMYYKKRKTYDCKKKSAEIAVYCMTYTNASRLVYTRYNSYLFTITKRLPVFPYLSIRYSSVYHLLEIIVNKELMMLIPITESNV